MVIEKYFRGDWQLCPPSLESANSIWGVGQEQRSTENGYLYQQQDRIRLCQTSDIILLSFPLWKPVNRFAFFKCFLFKDTPIVYQVCNIQINIPVRLKLIYGKTKQINGTGISLGIKHWLLGSTLVTRDQGNVHELSLGCPPQTATWLEPAVQS